MNGNQSIWYYQHRVVQIISRACEWNYLHEFLIIPYWLVSVHRIYSVVNLSEYDNTRRSVYLTSCVPEELLGVTDEWPHLCSPLTPCYYLTCSNVSYVPRALRSINSRHKFKTNWYFSSLEIYGKWVVVWNAANVAGGWRKRNNWGRKVFSFF